MAEAPGTPEQPSLLRGIRALPAPVWILCAGSFVNRLGSFVFPFLVIYVRSLGYSAAQAGLAASAYGVGALLSAVAGGWVADRLGRRDSIVLSAAGSVASLLALWRADTLGAVAVLAGAFGFASDLYRPASSALIADFVPPGRRVPAYALNRLAVNAGWAGGLALGGFLAERSFDLLFLGDAATTAAWGVIALVFLPRGARSPRHAERPGELMRAFRAEPRFLRFLVGSTLVAIAYFQGTSTFALHVRDSGFSNATYGLLLSLNGVLITVAELGVSAVAMRLPARRVMAVGIVLTGAGLAMLAGPPALWVLTASMVVLTAGEMVNQPVAAAYVADQAPAGLQGRFQGAWAFTFGIAVVVGPAAGTAVYQLSPGLLWSACGAICLLAAALVLTAPPPRAAALPGAPVAVPDLPGASL